MNPSWFLESAKALLPRLQAIREALHQFPELSFEEWETRKRIQAFLPKGFPPLQSAQNHAGLWGTCKGKGPGNGQVGLRADMDALPIQEDARDGRPYASKHPGIMHACGHDVHSTCLLGAIQLLKSCETHWGGELTLIFQPGEEKLPGGANLMMESGALDMLKSGPLLGLHVFPEAPVGTLGFRPGPYMASTDELHLQVLGSGGHAALPHSLTNPLLAAAELVPLFHRLPEKIHPGKSLSVVAIGKFDAPGATNVIPSLVRLEGTLRCLDPELRQTMHQHLQQTAEGIAEKHQVKVDLEIRQGYPPLVNHPAWTKAMQSKAVDLLGKEKVLDLPQRMTAEDFAFYGKKVPLVFMRLGTAALDGSHRHPVHHPAFDVAPESLMYGAAALAWLAFSRLSAYEPS